MLERQCEDATASATSSLFSKFSQEEFKEISIQTNKKHHESVYELFKTLDNIFETHMVFDNISIVLEDLVEKRRQASKDCDEVIDSQSHMKDKLDNVTFHTNFQLKRIRTILRVLKDLDETVAKAIKRA